MTAFWNVGKWMSKAKPPPGGIDCCEVIQRLYEYIDGELNEQKIEQIRVHLEKCKRCMPRYDFEKAFLRFVEEQAHVSAPPELRRTIFASLLEEEDEH